MSRAAAAVRLFNTARYLRPVQVYGRVWRKVPRPRAYPASVLPCRATVAAWTRPVCRKSARTGPTAVTLLNKAGEIARAEQWNDPAKAKLWLYHLHYFDDLDGEAEPAHAAWQRTLMDRWIAENPPGHGVGWEPYPLSRRIANWVKWALSSEGQTREWLASLAAQTRWLERHLEWYLLGNHLLANAKALVLAGLFFEGTEARRWLDRGLAIYGEQLREQVLPDGGHFELSPMYHAIVLEDLLDVWNAADAVDACGEPVLADLPRLIQRMRAWLRAMTHPDGEIAFFNDAAFAVAASPAELDRYCDRLGLESVGACDANVVHLSDSGYVRVEADGATAILDIAAIGPDYLPGHARADTLSFELSIGEERVIVNGGTSVYGTGEQRLRERSTAAHSTVEVDGENSSEVWGGFRVARRARVFGTEITGGGSTVTVAAAHDGYRRLPGRPTHQRVWRFEGRQLRVIDRVDGGFGEAVARFHLGGGVTVAAEPDGMSGVVVTPGGRPVSWRTSSPAAVEGSQWHPEFGRTVATRCLTVRLDGPQLESQFSW